MLSLFVIDSPKITPTGCDFYMKGEMGNGKYEERISLKNRMNFSRNFSDQGST